MNLQQMVEHMSEAVKMANGKDKYELVTPAEKVPAMYAFMSSEKEFKPDTKNVLMAEEPIPVKHASIEIAIQEFEAEVSDFETYYQTNPTAKLMNPFFGMLNYNDWCQLLSKHALHHLKQFGLVN